MSRKVRKFDTVFPFTNYIRYSIISLPVVFLGVVCCLLAIILIIFKDSLDNSISFGLFGMLAIVGILLLLLLAIGSIEMTIKPKIPLETIFMDSEPEGILITNERGHIIYANNAYNALTNAVWNKRTKSLESLLSRNQEASEALYRLINSLRLKSEGSEEFRLMQSLNNYSQNSEPHWYRLKARVLPISLHKEKLLYAWRITDITSERKDQEKFFRELQNAIDYLDHSPVGFMSADHQGKILYINATLAEWIGIDLTTFTSKSISIGDITAGEGLALIQAIRTEPSHQKITTLDLDLRRIDNGHGIPVKIVHHILASCDGKPGESRTVVVSRKNCDSGDPSGTIANMRFNRFFNNIPMAIASIDKKGRILRTNAHFLKLFPNCTEGDGTSNDIFSIVHKNEKRKIIAALYDANDQKSDISPIDSPHPQDENRYFRFYISATLDRSTEAPEEQAILYTVEITEQKALEARMAQTQKLNAVGTLAGGIAHDFNNVLTAILLSSDHLLLQSRSSDASFADLMEIKHNANRAAILVRQLLAFSRKQTMRLTVLNLTEVIGNLRMMIQKLISEPPQVKLTVDYERDLWGVKTDLSQFEQVLVNLCVNAHHAIMLKESGSLTVRTRNIPSTEIHTFNYSDLPTKDMVLVEVEDTGIGMSPDIMEKIFEPFFTTKKVGEGTGLGLSVVYGIIRQSGGYILPESEVGKGTIFRIFLPRYVQEHTQESHYSHDIAIIPQEEPADLTGNSAIVLLVEDEDSVRRGSKRMLETRGYTVHEAFSGTDALKVMEKLQGRVDIVISDVVMPEMDGPTLLRELRKTYPSLKFIFISGYAEDAFSKNLPKDAKFSFLSKPFSLKQLATSVHELLQSDS
ncbi:response regulator [Candidatus Liberibacter asiaticus]|nr:response regulator [Candidatus Liberibacter asiaticus]AGH16687.1 two-component sensor histidine kinase/response regulator hybrid protein [Candidatus Liberibacter asiaticus str. gxpsy]ALK07065.1 response regulator [Candidatus Liberibacter asiaticus]ASK52538.1 PAS sensor protein [Candidatus Liberibacter asiaticus]AWL13862.1 PAS domain-containing protein [Candidatus Liberibacter asiaticus]KAE9510339.1 Blue-light-activated protein [Candidatus Liberibacter asiaticus]